jgi:hypothetical protein
LKAMLEINICGRPPRTQYQYTLQDANLDELNQWSSKIFDKLKTLPELRDVATDQQTGRRDVDPDHRPRPGSPLWDPAAADRCWAQKGRRDLPALQSRGQSCSTSGTIRIHPLMLVIPIERPKMSKRFCPAATRRPARLFVLVSSNQAYWKLAPRWSPRRL